MSDTGDGWCIECGEFFHLDDTGGYRPPCPCGCGLCRDCCKAQEDENTDEWDVGAEERDG